MGAAADMDLIAISPSFRLFFGVTFLEIYCKLIQINYFTSDSFIPHPVDIWFLGIESAKNQINCLVADFQTGNIAVWP